MKRGKPWLSALLLGGATLGLVFLPQACAVEPGMDPEVRQPGSVEWPLYGLDQAETHYSPLDQIHADNVTRLGLEWAFDAESFAGQMEGTPLMVNGTLYGTLPWSVAFALDARTGQLKWRWDPQIPHLPFVTDERGVRYRRGPSLCCGPVNRGVAYYRGKVYMGTLDGRVVALDAETGQEVWSVQMTSKEDDYSITGAPRVVKGKVIVGNSGSEFGVRGFVCAYDPESGRELWRFWIVPGDPTLPFENEAMEMAAKTWNGAWWKYGGGGTAWDGMAYDPELDLLYIGTGNGSPWARDIRSPGGGDNLFLCSILALRPDTGEYVWHFQATPADSWDYASTQPMILTDLIIDDRRRKVLMQAPKNGLFYVIDRETGEFISARPFANITWAKGVDPHTGRPIETPEADYGFEGTLISPGSDGAHNWHAMSWSPGTGLVYIPGQETASVFSKDPDFQHQIGRMNTGRRRAPPRPAAASSPPPRNQPPRRRGPTVVGAGGSQQREAFLVAWDPVAQEERWRIRFERPGVTSGTLATAGNLLFHGSNDGSFSAYRADKGEKLWSIQLAPGFANPMTYMLDGRQYVAVATGRSGYQAPGRVYAFALDANTPVPSMDPVPEPPAPLGLTRDALGTVLAEFEQAGLRAGPGRDLIQQLCAGCHSPTIITRYRQSEEAWRLTVQDMLSRGMAGTPEQHEQVIRYLTTHLGPEN